MAERKAEAAGRKREGVRKPAFWYSDPEEALRTYSFNSGTEPEEETTERRDSKVALGGRNTDKSQ